MPVPRSNKLAPESYTLAPLREEVLIKSFSPILVEKYKNQWLISSPYFSYP